MNLQVFSDLHLEGSPDTEETGVRPVPEADMLILAGDIDRGARAVRRFADWPRPVIYVHGNLEARSGHMLDVSRSIKMQTVGTSVSYLEMETHQVENVRFLGCCLWTDFELYGAPSPAMREAGQYMPEFTLFRSGVAKAFSPEYSLELHQSARAWLRAELAKPFNGQTIVITHHAPHPKSIPSRFIGDSLSPAFASDLSPLMQHVDLWIHGHVHASCDYLVGKCRVLCNPRGYMNRRGISDSSAYENRDFNPQLVVTT
ncbi:metallophosphoesterase [Caballeronia novacaledonica]|uniref:Metallophosphoesterase n=1 Tax=Caballeronia novacaledonica TaxID=1544861 RepID=A0A2U3IC75_9BURK|nr:metallophosphoesterase [Caballeronia novacaledonica]SPB17801.1 metallophosphoesterase [Caballeronia novacaledonica]